MKRFLFLITFIILVVAIDTVAQQAQRRARDHRPRDKRLGPAHRERDGQH
jgi:hypothetical protein